MFVDRVHAGEQLAERLGHLTATDPVLLGIPRGGVVVAGPVAESLDVPLDVLVVRKLGVPTRPELAFGAIGEGGVRVLNDDVVERHGITESTIAAVEAVERRELERRVRVYRTVTDRAVIAGATAVLVDDGIASGATARAACAVVREAGAKRVVVTAPVIAPNAVARLDIADEIVAVEMPRDIGAVGARYLDFRQTSDDEVLEVLARHRG